MNRVLIMHDNIHNHVIMNIIVNPTMILHLQCSHFKYEYTAGVELRGEIVLKLLLSFCISAELRTLFLMVTVVFMMLLLLSMCRRHKCVQCFNFNVRRTVVIHRGGLLLCA